MLSASDNTGIQRVGSADIAAASGANQTPGQARMLTTREAARYLQLSSTYLNKMRVTGTGPVFVKLGRSVRYHQADLDAWITARRFTSTSAAQAAA